MKRNFDWLVLLYCFFYIGRKRSNGSTCILWLSGVQLRHLSITYSTSFKYKSKGNGCFMNRLFISYVNVDTCTPWNFKKLNRFWRMIIPNALYRSNVKWSILIETSSWNQRFCSEPPQRIRDSHCMGLPQTLFYRISSMQSFKSYLYVSVAILLFQHGVTL